MQMHKPAPSTAKQASTEINFIVENLTQLDPRLAVLLLGSRAKGKPKEFSDWDLGLTRQPKALDDHTFLTWKGYVSDWADDLPRFVDLINLDHTPDWFNEGLNYQPVFLGGNPKSWESFAKQLHAKQKK